MEEGRILGVKVKFVNIGRKIKGEGNYLYQTDAQVRKLEDQSGLETPVVLAVNDEC